MNEISTIDFIKGGNALFTVTNGSEHYTYKVRKPAADKPFFVSLVSGDGSGGKFSYLGIFKPETNDVITTRSSKFAPDALPVKVVRWVCKVLTGRSQLPAGYAIQHNGRCCRCGKKLTTPESINLGIGPECAKKNGVTN